MLRDSQYLNRRNTAANEIEHKYGANVHLLDDPYLFTMLAKLCHPECKQPAINQLLDILYRQLVKIVVNAEFPLIETQLQTRMASTHPEGHFTAAVIDPSQSVVSVNLARAGTLPSQICFDAFNYFLNSDGVRQDHISINRVTGANDQVVGANLSGAKIGGDINDAFVVIPDPMGATGSTIRSAMNIYKDRGKPKRFLAIHLVVTPEYLAAVTKEHPEIVVYAVRLDRGLSPPEILTTVPGTNPGERGLNAKQYIVPGAGGLGEVINNAYV
ncbi:MAG: uracil phosphoribosyltransferase [Deltaproteobacteria bacterium]|nr:uracil phosphoribosyltransferase [Deltaproteobacteria bacterium]